MDDNNNLPRLMAVILPMPPGRGDGGDPLLALRVHARTKMLDDFKPPVPAWDTKDLDATLSAMWAASRFASGTLTDTALDLPPARVPWWRRVLDGLRWSRRDAWR